METYEQHNEVSTSFKTPVKPNYECKEFYHKYERNEYRYKMDEASQSTPFSVKDILNHPPCYERNELWKYNGRDKRTYEYDTTYQPYCPDYYFNPAYPNLPVHNNIEYWTPESYHDHKVDDYYNYAPYCHNLYQSYEYAEVPFQTVETKVEETNEINVESSSPADPEVLEFVVPDQLPKDSMPKRNTSKIFYYTISS